MKEKPQVPDPIVPGPGNYNIKGFVDEITQDTKTFTFFKKEQFNYRNIRLSLF